MVFQRESEENMPHIFLKSDSSLNVFLTGKNRKKPLRQPLPFKLYWRNNSMVIAVFPQKIDSKLF